MSYAGNTQKSETKQLTFSAYTVYTECMAKRKLNSNDKEFFSLVSKAAFANPFSPTRFEIDKEITQQTAKNWHQVRPDAIEKVSLRIAELDKEKPSIIHDFQKQDSQIIQHAFLFKEYHSVNIYFDELIAKQIYSENPLPVPFAKTLINNLVARGFTKEEAKKYFAMFYQIRRAFYFIDKGLLGKCPAMTKLRVNLWNNIFTHNIFHYEKYLWDKMEDFSTLLLGPTGCGKGTAAAAIGRSGFIPFDEKKNSFAESFTQTFVPINLSQYPESLLESELFGHSKGAFTGAIADHNGIFAICSKHGSIFLDEIGEVSTQVQIKLLQVLQEREFTPVGSHKKLHFNGRVIAATNQPIDKLRNEGKFRDDFYYRLCSDCIEVPSLQMRIHENPSELDELIAKVTEKITGQSSTELIKTVTRVIDRNLGRKYHWPGNVRELEQCIRRVIIKQDYEGDNLHSNSVDNDIMTLDTRNGSLDAMGILSEYCKMLYARYGTYGQVAKITGIDQRTAKKHILK